MTVLYVKNGLIQELEEGSDTTIDDPSGLFKIGDAYSLEQWEIYNLSFDDWKSRKASEIDAKAQELVDNLAPEYPIFEELTFEQQRREADAYLADATVVTPGLSKIAEKRGLAVAEVAMKVQQKSARLSNLAMDIAGQRQKYHGMLANIAVGNSEAVRNLEVEYDYVAS